MSKEANREDRFIGWVVTGLLGLFLFLTLAPRIFVVVPAGHAAVLWRMFGGTADQGSYGEGLHLMWPWNSLAVYDMRLRSATQTFEAKAQGGLTVETTITFRFRPSAAHLATLHREVGPDYLESFVLPELGALVASEIARQEHSTIYESREGIQSDITSRIQEGGALRTTLLSGDRQALVDIPELFILRVKLPEDVEDVVQSKFAKMERLEAADYDLQLARNENRRLEVEGQGLRTFQKLLGDGLQAWLTWKSIEATRAAAESQNAKIVVVSPGQDVPVLLDGFDK